MKFIEHVVAVTCVLVAVSPRSAAAQTPPHPPATVVSRPSGPPTTIEALVDRAVAEGPSIKAAWARVDAAKGEIAQAAERANPELMTEGRSAGDGLNSGTSIGVALPLELGRRQGRTALAIDTAAQTALMANEEARQVAGRVRLAAIRALAAERLRTIADASVETHHQWCDLLAAKVASGSAAPLERDMAEVELRLGQAAAAKLRAEADARWAELSSAAGLDPATRITLVETLEQAVAAIRRPMPTMEHGVEDRPDIAAADAAIEVADSRIDLLRRESRLDLTLTATYMRSKEGFPWFGLTATGQPQPLTHRMNEFVIGATVALPWPYHNDGKRAAAAAEKKAAEFDRESRLVAARAEVAAAEARDREAGRVLEIYAGGLLDLSARNLDVVTKSYELGRVSRIEVTMEERRYRDVQTTYVAALQEAYEARVIWMQAMGGVR